MGRYILKAEIYGKKYPFTEINIRSLGNLRACGLPSMQIVCTRPIDWLISDSRISSRVGAKSSARDQSTGLYLDVGKVAVKVPNILHASNRLTDIWMSGKVAVKVLNRLYAANRLAYI